MHSHPVIRQQSKPKQEKPQKVKKEQVKEVASKAVQVEPIVQEEPLELDITAVVVNYQTIDLIKDAVLTFRQFYPTLSLVIVDNNSTDGSRDWIRSQKGDSTRVVLNRSNKGHGPALHKEFLRAKTKYVFTFDSDVVFLRPGLLEGMSSLIRDAYAIGWLRWVNHDGVAVDESSEFDRSKYCPYIHPYAALYHRETYLTLSPFVNNGAPAIYNMRDALKEGLEVKPFFLGPYVKHLVAGTRRMWRGHWYPENKPPMVQWSEDSNYPI